MTTAFRYDNTTITLHWATAALISLGWVLAQLVDSFGKAVEPSIVSLHILFGLVLLPVLVGRIALRLSGRSRPPADPGVAALAARFLHGVLYLLIIATIVMGVANAWMRGSNVFGLFQFAAAANPDRVLRRSINGWHELAANTLVILALLHAGAALLHHYVLRDDVLRRMLPPR